MKGKNEKSRKNPEPVQEILNLYRRMEKNPTDPQGSYTGRPKDVGDVPVQDADDL